MLNTMQNPNFPELIKELMPQGNQETELQREKSTPIPNPEKSQDT